MVETPRGDAESVVEQETGKYPDHPVPVVVEAYPMPDPAATFGTQQTTLPVGGLPKLIAGASPKRRRIIVRNQGAKSVFLAATEQVSTGTGFELVSLATVEIAVRCDVWAVADAADTSRVDVLALFE